MADRAGHWKHEWVPLDYTAAKEKGHGHVPESWSPQGDGEAGRKLLREAAAKHGVKINELEHAGTIHTHAKEASGITLVSHQTNRPGEFLANGERLSPDEVGKYLAAHKQHPWWSPAALLDEVRGTRGGVPAASRHDVYVERTRGICRSIGLRL